MKRKQQKSDDMWIMVLGQGAWDEKSVTTFNKKNTRKWCRVMDGVLPNTLFLPVFVENMDWGDV